MNSEIRKLYVDYIAESKSADEIYKAYQEQSKKADAAKYAWLNGAAAASGDDSQPYGVEHGKQFATFS